MTRLWVLAIALLTLPAVAEEDARALAGQPVLELARHEGVASLVHTATGGLRGEVSRRLRDPGPGLAVMQNRYVYGWGCGTEGCAAGGIFLAQDIAEGRVFILLLRDGRTRLAVPPNPNAWPAAVGEAMMGFDRLRAEQVGGR
ncbi:hypothetical protein [Plastoroseomonas hellenica]|uniref:hypothetical protein n=1 Tax=Plastoroseomonas hellenica TaxID=2687306 RepID=UPI001BA8DCEF|nr:hypothetical protein [Plastoroseomonas hellenica]MBR0645269.1 hypothetical protein [Plastoroseomonas hellenica]